MRGLPQKQNARRADKIRLCGHLGRYKKIVKKTYIIYINLNFKFIVIYSSNIFNLLAISSGSGSIAFMSSGKVFLNLYVATPIGELLFFNAYST